MRASPVGLRAELAATLDELAAFGEKRVGTEAGARAAEYILARMRALGLEDVRAEAFAFPRHDVLHATVELTVAGGNRAPSYAVLEASGGGVADGQVVHVGWATDEQLAGVDLRGKL